MARIYNDPVGGSASSVGSQIRTDHYQKKALIELVKEQFFGPLADVTAMPKNMGKKIKRFHYLPLLDDRNINDQGLDAAGAVLNNVNYVVSFPAATLLIANAGSAAAVAAINDALDAASNIATDAADDSGGTGFTAITLSATSQTYSTLTKATAAAANVGGTMVQNSGFLYGSAKDIGAINSKLPALTENGGQVNRVGFKRLELEGTIEKFGFADTYTQESLDFDTDAELEMHINREMLRGANELVEDMLQIDLLNGAGVIHYGGLATSDATMTGVAADTVSEISYTDLVKLGIELDANRCPKKTTIIAGSRMVDTRVVNAARVLFIGSEMSITIQKMTNFFSAQAFIPVAQYADAGNLINGEIGAIGDFRIVVVPEMAHWAGAGAIEGTNAGYRATAGKYNIYPLLVVGDGSFTTIGFQTDGKTTKFKIKHSKPGSPESYAQDYYGETGFMSIKWYYGSMILRSERLALMKSVAQN